MPKTLKLFGKEFKIKQLTALDFFGEGGLPIQFFQAKSPKTMYQQIIGDAEKPGTESDYQKQIEFMKKILSRGVLLCDGKSFDADQYMKTETNLVECTLVINSILELSLNFFRGPMSLTRDEAIFFDFQAKRYGKTPIECAFPSGGYSDLDAQMFNSFVMTQGINFDNTQAKKQAATMKRR